MGSKRGWNEPEKIFKNSICGNRCDKEGLAKALKLQPDQRVLYGQTVYAL